MHTPQRTLVSQYFSDKEREKAILCIAREMRRWSDQKKLKKLRKKEGNRKESLEEIVQVDQMLQRSEEAAKARELKVSSRDLAAI